MFSKFNRKTNVLQILMENECLMFEVKERERKRERQIKKKIVNLLNRLITNYWKQITT